MPLRLRRGTDQERLTITPLEGELIYVTDSKRLYIGDGSSVGGIDIVASAGGALQSNLNLNTYDITGPGNISIIGNITATNITGTNFTGNFIGNTTGTHFGDVVGNIIGNQEGNFEGTLLGSVFGNNSSVIVDGNTNSIFTSQLSITENIISANSIFQSGLGNDIGQLQIGGTFIGGSNPHTQIVRYWEDFITSIERNTGISQGPNGLRLDYLVSRGTIAIPESNNPGDRIYSSVFSAHDGIDYVASSAIFADIDPNNTILPGTVPGRITLLSLGIDGPKFLTFDSFGRLGVNKDNPTETLDVNGNAIISGTIVTEGIISQGISSISSALINTLFANNLTVEVGATFGGPVTATDYLCTGTATFDGALIARDISCNGGGDFSGPIFSSDITCVNNATIGGTLEVNNIVSSGSGSFVGSIFSSDITCLNATFGGTLNSNNALLNEATISLLNSTEGNITTLNSTNSLITNLTVSGNINVNQINTQIIANDSTILVNNITKDINANILNVNYVSSVNGLFSEGPVVGGSVFLANRTIGTTDSSNINVAVQVVFDTDIEINGRVTASEFCSDSIGSPELIAATDLRLGAGNAVVITNAPFRLAKFTTTERDTLLAVNGDIIYNTTTNKFQGYENGSWVNLI